MNTVRRARLRGFALLILLSACLNSGYAALSAVSLSDTVAATQNFDGIGTAAAATLPADFKADRLASVRTTGTFAAAGTTTTAAGGANLSGTAANGIYNFGAGTTATGTDRAIGFLSSGTATQSGNLYGKFTNPGPANFSALKVSYAVEKYRGGTNPAGFCIQLYYSTDGNAWTSAGGQFLTSFGADAANAGFSPAPGATVNVTDQTLTVPVASQADVYLAWNYSVCSGSTTTNAQALAIDDISVTGISGVAGTNPAGTGSANPPAVAAGASTLLAVAVTPGTNPASTSLTVTANLSAVGGAAAQALFDDGSHGDVTAADNTFSFAADVSAAVPTSTASLPFTVADAQGRTGSGSIALSVTGAPVTTSPSATGTATPDSVAAGGVTVLAVTVTPGSNPASTGLSVTADLSSVGGSSVGLHDDGLNGDATAGDHVFAAQVTVAGGAAPGNVLVPVTVTDAEGRSAAPFSIALTIQGPVGATTVRISQVYGGGGNGGSTIKNDFIELFNPGSTAVSLAGWSVQYISAAGSTAWAVTPLSGSIAPGHYYLVQELAGAGGTVDLPTPDAVGTIAMGATAGKVALVSTTTALSGANGTGANLGPAPPNTCPTITGAIVDFVGYGGATCFEGTGPTAVLANTTAALRAATGCTDTNNNSGDFAVGAPSPRTSATAAADCSATGGGPGVPSTAPIVISQLYGGGGNAGATYQSDYVELYNRSTSTVDIGGWSLQYTSAAGDTWASNIQPLGGTMAPGEYLLIGLASGGVNGQPLPPANLNGIINMSQTSGKVALTNSFDPLVGNCPTTDPHVVDFVGYGAADCGEGSTDAPTLSSSTAAFRLADGATDTDRNGSDFTTGTPGPRRTAPIVELGPAVLATDPRVTGTNVPRDATIEVTFTEPVTVTDPWFDITCAVTGKHNSATVSIQDGSRSFYITPNDNFTAGETCTATLFKLQVFDQDLDDAGPDTDNLKSDFSWSFTIATGAAPPEPPAVHVTMGNPSSAIADLSQPDNYLMLKPEYAESYNRDFGRPNWVSWHLTDEWTGTLLRVDTFRADPAVPPEWYRVESFDFSGTGFDRGHMTPNADRDNQNSIPVNQATYLMTNMVAQAPDNNQGPWAAFENFLRTLLPANEIYIVSGPRGIGGIGSNGGDVVNTVADGHVTVPSSTWKVAMVLPKLDGDDASRVTCSTRTIAVEMPNVQGIRNDAWQTYLTTPRAIETETGYNFFSNLPEPIQNCVEPRKDGDPELPLIKGSQTIGFDQPADVTFGDLPFTVAATGGISGNPVTFAAVGACSASGTNGSLITITAGGSCTITASQAGSDLYDAAAPVVRTLTVHPANTSFSGINAATIEAGSPTVTISGALLAGSLVPSGSVAVTIGGTTTQATVAADGTFSAAVPSASLTPAGSPYLVSVSYPGNANFAPSASTSTVTVVDTTAPSITGLSVSPSILTPPNHKLVDIAVAFTVTDATGAVCSTSVASNQPLNGRGDGNTAVDWQVLDAHHVLLRAERSGPGTVRIYTLTVSCSDASHNASSTQATVTVPK